MDRNQNYISHNGKFYSEPEWIEKLREGRAAKKLYETLWLGEDEGLKELVKRAQIDEKQEAYNPMLGEWFYHLLTEDRVSAEENAKMKYKSEHICQKDL